MTTIRYFIPEDGDSELQPNVFLAPKPRQQGYPPTLGQVKHSFPLPGRYHFRFKTPLVPGSDREKGALPVWMDCTDDRQPVFVWRNQIIAKVTRVGVEEDDDDDDDDFQRPPPQQAPAATHHTPAPVPAPPVQQKAPSFDLFDAPSSNNQHHHHVPPPQNNNDHHRQSSGHSNDSGGITGNLLDGHHTAPSASSGSGNLLDMNTHSYSHQPAPSSAHNDFLGMTATTTPAMSAPSPPVSGNFNNAFIQQQQHQQQQQQQARTNFNSFGASQDGPFGGLGTPWK